MASTIAFYSGLSGLNANARNLDVIGNNIANVNTTAFKSSRMLFSSMVSLNYSLGAPPGANDGGSNPYQVGLGVGIAGTQRDTTGGSISGTGDARDLAIEGDGYFVVQQGETVRYTREGSFRLNAENQLTNVSGDRLQGYAVDDDFNVLTGELTDITIPLGSLNIARATTRSTFQGNLNAAGDLPTQGTSIALNALGLVTGPVGGNLLEETSLLTDIADPAATSTPLFSVGQQIEVSGATKGSKTLPTAAYTIDAASTVTDLMDFLTAALGINTDAGDNPDGTTPGVALDPATGVLTITGNTGAISELEIDAGDLRVLDADGNLADLPFTPTALAEADGESARTTFLVYDSRGNPVSVDITFVLESNSETGSTWRYFAESADDSDAATVVGTGTLSFDVFGQPIGETTGTISIDRDGSGAASPLAVTLDFDSEANGLTSLSDTDSNVASTYQDGSSLGTLTAYGFGSDGTITGTFSNGLTRTLGQIALANFNNAAGLVDVGGNLFAVGANSGEAIVTAPTQLGAGRLIPGSLELSNVDLSQEFINLILSSTGYSASSRVITTTDQLMQQLLVLGR